MYWWSEPERLNSGDVRRISNEFEFEGNYRRESKVAVLESVPLGKDSYQNPGASVKISAAPPCGTDFVSVTTLKKSVIVLSMLKNMNVAATPDINTITASLTKNFNGFICFSINRISINLAKQNKTVMRIAIIKLFSMCNNKLWKNLTGE